MYGCGQEGDPGLKWREQRRQRGGAGCEINGVQRLCYGEREASWIYEGVGDEQGV